MRHRVKLNHLGRKSAHRKALLSHLACDLIENKRIITTLAKAKALRGYVEPLITKSKDNTTHQRRVVFSYLQKKEVVAELFGDISAKIGDRPGGYTRIIKLGARLGDAAEMALIELVDYNEIYSNEPVEKEKKKRTRRGGSRTKNAADEAAPKKEENTPEAKAKDSEAAPSAKDEKESASKPKAKATTKASEDTPPAKAKKESKAAEEKQEEATAPENKKEESEDTKSTEE